MGRPYTSQRDSSGVHRDRRRALVLVRLPFGSVPSDVSLVPIYFSAAETEPAQANMPTTVIAGPRFQQVIPSWRGGHVASAKQTVRDVLKQLPEDCTLEDVQYQLYLRQKLEKSRKAAAENRVMPHREVKKRLSKWLER